MDDGRAFCHVHHVWGQVKQQKMVLTDDIELQATMEGTPSGLDGFTATEGFCNAT